MKGRISYFDDRDNKIKEMMLDLELATRWARVTGWWIWAEGKCPFDGTPLSFDIVTDKRLSSDMRRMIKEVAELKEEYIRDGAGKELREMIDEILWRYSEFPTETVVAGECIHFNPTKYMDEEEEEEIGIEELLGVETGVASVDEDEIVKEILKSELDEMESAIREYGSFEDIRKLNEIKRRLK